MDHRSQCRGTQFVLCLITLWSASVPGIVASAADQAASELRADAALMKKIAELPDNTWMQLPAPNTAGDLSWLGPKSDYGRQGPRIRDYCNKMAWAPDRKLALYCGAGHNIHLWNDVWEYDLPSNTWVCLFAADPAAHRKRDEAWYQDHAVYRDGVIRTPRNAPLRPAHTWWGLCYDSGRRRLVFWDAHKGLLFTNRKLIASALNIDPQADVLKSSGSGPGEAWIFEFDPSNRVWTNVLRQVPKSYESSQLEYISRNKTLWLHSRRTFVLDANRETWEPHTEGFNSNGAVSAYDPDSNIVVLVNHAITREYDCAKQTWAVTVENGPDTVRIPHGTFCYDSVARKFVLFTTTPNAMLKGSRMWLYDLETSKWSDPRPDGGCPQLGGVAGYYDAARNVTVIYSNRETWVYRGQNQP